MSCLAEAIDLLEPQQLIPTIDWLPVNIRMPKGTETAGRSFLMDEYPHCDGPCEAVDDPEVREIDLQWGTRMGKTILVLSLFAKFAEADPHNMLLAGPTKHNVGRITKGRLYPILDACPSVSHELPPKHERNMFEIRMRRCTIYTAWAGSDSILADIGAYFGVANEVDKWEDGESKESDPEDLFDNRFKGFKRHKKIFESTPTIKGKSRIERRRLASMNHRRYVPCPFCGERQILKKGTREGRGGIKWDTDSHGNSNAEIAFNTAYYECEFCLRKIENHHRMKILQAGKWVPDGCTIDADGNISGTPLKEGCPARGFGPLASWYSTLETWGDFAKSWVSVQGKPRLLQGVINSYMAETWERRKTRSKEEDVGLRLNGNFERGSVPRGVEFIIVSVDRQQADGGFCPWCVLGFGENDKAWLIDYGISESLPLVWDNAIRQQWPPVEGREGVTIAVLSGVDSGWEAKATYDFCSEHPDLTIAVKGASTDLGGKLYDKKTLSEGRRGAGQELLLINVDAWESDLQNRLEKILANETGSLTLCREASFDNDFLTQLCNADIDDSTDKRGKTKLLWVLKDDNVPNDYRDCVRNGLCLAQYYRNRDDEDDREEVPLPPGYRGGGAW